MIRDLTKKSNHRSIEPEWLKRKKLERELEKSKSGDDLDRMYLKS